MVSVKTARRRLITRGGSGYVNIPKSWMRLLRIKRGKKVVLRLTEKGKVEVEFP